MSVIKGIYSALANAIQTIHVTRFLPPGVIVMHPRRWGWLLTLLDTQNRPLFVPDGNSAFNAAGILEDVDSQQVVGRTHGLPIVTDPNIATNLGAGTNEDQIFVGVSATSCSGNRGSARGYYQKRRPPT